jgi:hypothetical protein
MPSGDQQSYAIDIPRAGQHPYMPGSVRLSTVLIIVAWWFLGALSVMQFVEPSGRSIIASIVILCIGTAVIWFTGWALARNNPFHQEVMIRSAVRSLRGRANLET